MSDHSTLSSDAPPAEAHDDAPRGISDVLMDIAATHEGPRMSVGALIDGLRDRAFGMVLLILALPCAVPFLYGIPQAVSLPLLFVAVQIVIGRHRLWLPQRLRARGFSSAAFRDMVTRAAPYIRWIEVLSRPRLSGLSHGTSERIFGVFIAVFSLSIALPLPLTNTVPGIAIGIMALGFMERDGLMILAGTVLGSAWVAFLVAVASGAVHLIERAFAWLTG